MGLLNNILAKITNVTNENSVYRIELERLENTCFAIRCHLPYTWLIDIHVTFKNNRENVVVEYTFYEAEAKEFFVIMTELAIKQSIKSLTHLWKNSSLFEQEISENFGIDFSRDYQNRYQSFSKGQFDIEISEKPKMTKKASHFYCKTNGHLISSCHVETGEYYLNIEKKIIGHNIYTALNFIEGYFSGLGPFWGNAFAQIVEDNYQIEVPDRAQGLRMVLLELSRILNHLKGLLELFEEIDLISAKISVHQMLRRIQAIFISYSGNEFGMNLIRTGGVTKDARQDWVSRTINELIQIELNIKRLEYLVLDLKVNQIILNFNIANKSDVSELNISGPLARVAGLNIDLRKTNPSYFYSDVEFEVPVGVQGSAQDIVRLKLQEILESSKIVSQVLDNLPTGAHMHPQFQDIYLDKEYYPIKDEQKYKDTVKELRKYKDFKGEVFFEGPNGISGLKLQVKDEKIESCHFVLPDRLLKKHFELKCVGHELEYLTSLWGCLNINLKEVER